MYKQILAVLATLLLIAIFAFPVIQLMTYDQTHTPAALQKLVPEADLKRAKADYIALTSGDLDALQERMGPELHTPETRVGLAQMHDMIPTQSPQSAQIVNMNWRMDQTPNGRQVRAFDLTLAYHYPDKTVIYTASYIEEDGKTLINGMHVNPDGLSLIQQHKLSFNQLTSHHILFIITYLVLAAITAWALYSCLMTTGLKWKWAWAIFILIGIGTVSFQWSGGAVTRINALSFRVPSAAISQMFFQSAVVHFSLPLGAVLFLLRQFKSRKATPVTLTQDEPAT